MMCKLVDPSHICFPELSEMFFQPPPYTTFNSLTGTKFYPLASNISISTAYPVWLYRLSWCFAKVYMNGFLLK